MTDAANHKVVTELQRAEPATPEDRLLANGDAVARLRAALGSLSPNQPSKGSISEAASEIQPRKPKRGRPRHHPFWDVAYGKSNAKSDHGKANSGYAYDAALALFRHRTEYPEVLELTGYRGPNAFSPDGSYDSEKWKLGILAELGRLIWKYSDGEDVALRLAVELAQMRPKLTVKQAVAWIRGQRVPKKRIGSSDGVFEVVYDAIDNYWTLHPDTPLSDIREAIESVLGFYSVDEGIDETLDATSTGPTEAR